MTPDEIVEIARGLLSNLDKQRAEVTKALFSKKAAQSDNCLRLEPEEINAALLSEILTKLVKTGLMFDAFYKDPIKNSLKGMMTPQQQDIFKALEELHRAQQPSHTKTPQQPKSSPGPGFFKEPPKVNRIAEMAKTIYDKRMDFFNAAEKHAKHMGLDERYIPYLAYKIIKKELETKGITFEDIQKDKDADAIVKSSTTLMLILKIHQMSSSAGKANIQQPNQAADECKAPDDARNYADKHAQEGRGFLTMLGLKDVPRDEFKQKLKGIEVKSHPDKRPDNADANELFNAARAVKELMDEGTLDRYLQLLEKGRNQPKP